VLFDTLCVSFFLCFYSFLVFEAAIYAKEGVYNGCKIAVERESGVCAVLVSARDHGHYAQLVLSHIAA